MSYCRSFFIQAVADFIEPGPVVAEFSDCTLDGRSAIVHGTLTNDSRSVRDYTLFVTVDEQVDIISFDAIEPGETVGVDGYASGPARSLDELPTDAERARPVSVRRRDRSDRALNEAPSRRVGGDADGRSPHRARRPTPTRSSVCCGAACSALLVIGFATFWIWALFFASKEAVNRIDDRAWADRSEALCLQAAEDRIELTDLRPIVDVGPELIRERADIVDRATDILETDARTTSSPCSPATRRAAPSCPCGKPTTGSTSRIAATSPTRLRETGENRAFYETEIDAIPISERIATFAGDNEMATCSPPYDLSR